MDISTRACAQDEDTRSMTAQGPCCRRHMGSRICEILHPFRRCAHQAGHRRPSRTLSRVYVLVREMRIWMTRRGTASSCCRAMHPVRVASQAGTHMGVDMIDETVMATCPCVAYDSKNAMRVEYSTRSPQCSDHALLLTYMLHFSATSKIQSSSSAPSLRALSASAMTIKH